MINGIDYLLEKTSKGNILHLSGESISKLLSKKDLYEFKIISQENIKNIFSGPSELKISNNDTELLFNVDKHISLEDYIKTGAKININDIAQIYRQINEILFKSEDYLLSENSLILDLKYIFIDKEKQKNKYIFVDTKEHFKDLKFIYIPEYKGDLSYSLIQFNIQLLRHIDINDKASLNLAYQLFMASFSISSCNDVINKAILDNNIDCKLIPDNFNKNIQEDYEMEM